MYVFHKKNFLSFNSERQIMHMYGTVLNHTYKGKLKKTSVVKNPKDYGKWNYAKTTHLVCKVDDDHPTCILISNTAEKHAEVNLIQELIRKSKLKLTNISSGTDDVIDGINKMSINPPSKRKKIIIYINNSPCSECADALIDVLDSNVQVRLKLYVASLYYIRRKSCDEEYHNEFVPSDKHKSNFNGLKKLMLQARCKIKAFTKDVWEELFNIVALSSKTKTELVNGYGHVMDDNDRSRESEDTRIQEDLYYIRTSAFEKKEKQGSK